MNIIRNNFETAYRNGSLTILDVQQGYAGLYLELFTEFECIIENLFIGLIKGLISHSNNTVSRKIRVSPVVEAESILLNGKSYIDWLPYDEKTLKLAKIYFTDSRPFAFLDAVQKGKLTNYYKIRNAIAHKSSKSIRDFNQVIIGLTLLPDERTPVGFLRNIPNPANGKTQLEIAFEDLEQLSNTLHH